jgi:hypothetical protein
MMILSFVAQLLACLLDLLTTRRHSERAKDLEIALLRQQLRLLQVYGNLHAQHSESKPARERLEAALAIFRRLGARKDVERTEQLLATHLHQHQ